jgi:hypothetical protein
MADDVRRADRDLSGASDVTDGDFQRRWLEARHLSWDDVEAAFRHGLEARTRFADRPFPEVADRLRESWEGMARGVAWEQVDDVVRGGYERNLGAGFEAGAIAFGPDALRQFPLRTIGGSTLDPGSR